MKGGSKRAQSQILSSDTQAQSGRLCTLLAERRDSKSSVTPCHACKDGIEWQSTLLRLYTIKDRGATEMLVTDTQRVIDIVPSCNGNELKSNSP